MGFRNLFRFSPFCFLLYSSHLSTVTAQSAGEALSCGTILQISDGQPQYIPCPATAAATASSFAPATITLSGPCGTLVTLSLPPGASITGLTTITTDGQTYTISPITVQTSALNTTGSGSLSLTAPGASTSNAGGGGSGSFSTGNPGASSSNLLGGSGGSFSFTGPSASGSNTAGAGGGSFSVSNPGPSASVSTIASTPSGSNAAGGGVGGSFSLSNPSASASVSITIPGASGPTTVGGGGVSSSLSNSSPPASFSNGGTFPGSNPGAGSISGTNVETLTGPSGTFVTTLSSGQPLITGPTVITSGNQTISVAPVQPSSSPTNVETLTGPSGTFVTTLSPGQPPITGPTVITTGSQTISVSPLPSSLPLGSPSIGSTPGIVVGGSTIPLGSQSRTITEPNGATVVIGPSGIVIGSNTIPLPTGPTTITTDGFTITDAGEVPTSIQNPIGSGSPSGSASASGSINPPPLITPPPDGSPGSIPTGIPSLSSPAPQVDFVFQGDTDTFMLPWTSSVGLLQTDGSTITLFPSQIVSGGATLSIPSVSSATVISGNGISISAGPGSVETPDTGGISGFGGLLNALKSLSGPASSLANTLRQIDQQGVSWAAGSLSDASWASSVEGLFGSALSDLGSWISGINGVTTAESIELQEMTEDGLRTIFQARTAAVEEVDLLQSLRKLATNLNNIKQSSIILIKDYWVQGSLAAATLAAAEEALRNFGNYPWGNQSPQSTTSSSSSSSTGTVSGRSTSTSSTSSGSASPTPFIFGTKTGTDSGTFQSYIKTLPDQGAGIVISYPNLPWQSYVTSLTPDQASAVSKQSFVLYVQQIVEDNGGELRAMQNATTQLYERTPAAGLNLNERPNSAKHLSEISTGNQKDLNVNGQNGDGLDDYLYDPSLGAGHTIYVLDSGCRTSNNDFANRQIGSHVVSNQLTLANFEPDSQYWAPEDLTDYLGHGTEMASVAAGNIYGVASKANLVIVKFRNGAVNKYAVPPAPGVFKIRGVSIAALVDAFDWTLNDILVRQMMQEPGKYIISLSYGWPFDSTLYLGDNRNTILSQRLNQAWGSDVVTVTGAGNDGPAGFIDQTTPQALGTSTNGLITVGGVDFAGVLYDGTSRDRGQGGSITFYGPAVNVESANYQNDNNQPPATSTGTSLATAMTSGLAAYFFGLTSLNGEWTAGSVSRQMKAYIARYAYVRNSQPVPPNTQNPPAAANLNCIYNRAPDGLCSGQLPSKLKRGRFAERQATNPSDVPVVVSGTIVGASLSQLYCPASSSSLLSSSSSSSSVSTTSQNPFPTLGTATATNSVPSNAVPSQCGPGILCSVSLPSVSATSASSTSSSSSASSPAPARPSPTALNAGWITHCEPVPGGFGEEADCTSSWYIWDHALDADYFPCGSGWDARSNNEFPTNSPPYPAVLGTWDVPAQPPYAYTTCTLQVESSSDPGRLTCDGGANVACSIDNNQPLRCADGEDTWFPWRYCVLYLP